MKAEELRDQFHNEQGIKWENSQGEPDIEYVQWLEQKVIRREIYAKSVAVEFGNYVLDKWIAGETIDMDDNELFDTWIKNSH